MLFIKKIISISLIITQLVMLVGILPARADNPVATNFVCGQDINNNGYLGDPGEYQSCQTASINHSSPANTSCLTGYTMQSNGACLKYEYAPLGNECQAGYFVQNGRCIKEEYLQPQAYCPSGYTPAGNGCVMYTYTSPTTSCPAGSFIQGGRCVTQSQVQPSGTPCSAYPGASDSGSGLCMKVVPEQCNSGSISRVLPPGTTFVSMNPLQGGRMCGFVFRSGYICTQGSLVNGVCVVTHDAGAVQTTCPSGSVLEGGTCKFTNTTNLNYLCSVGTLENGSCKVSSDAGPVQAVCNAGYTVVNGQCQKTTQSDVQYSCTQGTLNGTSCVWNTSENYCPIGVDQTCINNNGGSSCSPNTCIDIGVNKPVDEGNVDGSMLVDDGKKTEDGLCMDQLFIFSGRGQDCKLSGVDTAFKNCCKSEGKVFTDSQGAMYSNLSTAASTISKLYTAAQEAYTYYTVAMQATGDVAVASSMAAQGFNTALMAAFNPATIAISVAMYFVMEYLMQACDQTSMETAMAASSGYCHEVGTYCKKKIPLLGCVQKATSYCCFNSKLARILHEQGRPQLTGFNGWGTASDPQCRGFTPEEFSALDFSKIDLSEYVEDMVLKTTNEIQGSVNQITQDFYNKTN